MSVVVVLLLQPCTNIWPLAPLGDAIQCPLSASLSSLFAGHIASVNSLGFREGEQQWFSGGVLALGIAVAFAAAFTECSPAVAAERPFTRYYELDNSADPVGLGGFGVVLPARHKGTGEIVAVKRIPRLPNDLNESEVDAEVEMLKTAGEHRSITSFYDIFKDSDNYYLVMEMAKGKDLFDHLVNFGILSETETSQVMFEILEACSFLHGQGIVHGDIKPENIIISRSKTDDDDLPGGDVTENGITTTPDSNGNIIDVRIADFGTAVQANSAHDGHVLSGNLSTLSYSPPEVIAQQMYNTNPDPVVRISPKSDVWALGVILYILLFGRHPYDLDASASEEEVAERILTTQPNFSDPSCNIVSPAGIDLLKSMMHRDPNQRPTCQGALSHVWLGGYTGQTTTAKRRVTTDIRLFTARRRMMKACLLASMSGLVKRKSYNPNTNTFKIGSRHAACEMIDRGKKGYINVFDIMSTMELLGEKVGHEQAKTMLSSVDGDVISSCNEVRYDQIVKLVTPLSPPTIVEPGYTVYSEGDVDDVFYLIQRGNVEFSMKNQQKRYSSDGNPDEFVLQSFKTGDHFGEVELALQKGTTFPRICTCKCSSVDNCELLLVRKEQFQLLANTFGSINRRINSESKMHLNALLKDLLGILKGENMILEPGEKLENVCGLVVVKGGSAQVEDVHSNRVFTLGPKDYYFVCGPGRVMPNLESLARTSLYIKGLDGKEPSQITVIHEAEIMRVLGRKSMAGVREYLKQH